MNGFGEFVDGLKEVKEQLRELNTKQLRELNTKLTKLDTFDTHVVELTAAIRELIKVIKEKNI